MNRERLPVILSVGAFLFLVVAGAAGVWWYLFGPNEIDSAELVPGNTIAFASIPNGAMIVEALQTSQAKQLLDSPNIKPLHDYAVDMIGKKNVDLWMRSCRISAGNRSSRSPISITTSRSRSA